MSKIRAIVFDLDNTLIDFVRMKEESCKAAVRAMVASGLRMKEDEAYDRLMQIYFAVGIESDNAFSEFLKNAGQFDSKILAAGIKAYLKTKREFLEPYPHVKPVLRELKRRRLALSIVTDAPKTKACQRLSRMRIDSYFGFIIGHEDTGKMKKTGLPLLLVVKLLRKELPGIANSEILMVGDSMEKDIVPAKKLGLKTALSRYGQKTAETGTCDFELLDINDLADIV
jgi:putative hydrolase of the HAD superfamily